MYARYAVDSIYAFEILSLAHSKIVNSCAAEPSHNADLSWKI